MSTIRKFINVTDGKIELVSANLSNLFYSDINANFGMTISIDGSSTRTGIAIFNETVGRLIGTIAFEREGNEDYIEYKVRLKNFVKKLIDGNLNKLTEIHYEEPIFGYAHSTEVLMAIRTTVREILIEGGKAYCHIKYIEINNQKWKRILLHPVKVPSGTDAQKEAVAERVCDIFGESIYSVGVDGKKVYKLTQDEMDAVGIAVARYIAKHTGIDNEELASRKKCKPFKYNIDFFEPYEESNMEESEQDMMEMYGEIVKRFKVPSAVLENGTLVVQLNGNGQFNKHVYENMGNEDKLLILGFKRGKYVNVLIENQRPELCNSEGRYLYAFVWRKSRKVIK